MPPPRRWPPLGAYPEIVLAGLARLVVPLSTFWRRSWIYRRLLTGPIADRIRFYPYDALPRRLEDADQALRGRFRFGGESLDVRDGSIFDKAPPSAEWASALHAFEWLPPLSAAGGEPARVLATNLISQWIKRHSRYTLPAWSAEVMARRLLHLFAHGRLVLAQSDVMWRSRLFVSLREQSRALARIGDEAADGLPRIEAAAAVALSGACLDDHGGRLELGVTRLLEQLNRQILPDGGHVSRSPEALLHAYRFTSMVIDAMHAVNRDVPVALRTAHDRMAPMIRFFRHGDGALALFNGGGENDTRMIAGLLARDEARGLPFGHAPHSCYQRLALGKTFVIQDCGAAPPPGFSTDAHAGCLSFEMSVSGHRLVVNCGRGRERRWETALRATAAHSTVTVADTSSSAIMPGGVGRNLLGARLIDGPSRIATARDESERGITVTSSHDGYRAAFGIVHERTLSLGTQGTSLSGLDRLLPREGARSAIDFMVRFHIHPDVRVSASQGGGILLKLPEGEGWRFKAEGGGIAVEESIYVGRDGARRADQLVVAGSVKDRLVEIGWLFEQIPS